MLPSAAKWTIAYLTKDVEAFVLALPDGFLARYLRLTDMMLEFGPNLGMPHTRAMGEGLFELRVKAKEGIARVFFCTVVGQRIVILHGFIKKSEKTPPKELRLARRRLSEVNKL
jgi:phage-related protein